MSLEGPVAPHEIDRLFAPLARYANVILAISGGADSMTLMHAYAAWLQRQETSDGAAQRAVAITVDHGLRAGSAAEAEWVGRQAASFGLPHETLRWDGPKPETGIQEAARKARYGLLAERACVENGARAIVTAHHQDDQAETLLMRLSRGSGIDGLCGMRIVEHLWTEGTRVDLVRPLIDVPRARLVATLEHLGAAWLDDPSNGSEVYERVRLRKARPQLADLGLTSAQIARSARRLRRAQEALETGAVDLWGRAVELHQEGYVTIDRAVCAAAPAELRLRIVLRALAVIGGQSEPVRLAKAERLLERLDQGSSEAETLAGCIVVPADRQIAVFREPGREGLAPITLVPGESATWDGRFLVRAAADTPGPIEVRALGARTYATLRDRPGCQTGIPTRAAMTLPSFWRGEVLLAVPHLGADLPAAGGCAASLVRRDWERR